MGPITQNGETDFGNRQTESWLGKLDGTDSLISVGPKRYEREIECLHWISVGPIAHLGLTETLRRETERLQYHLGETEIPIGETEKTRVSGSGYVN